MGSPEFQAYFVGRDKTYYSQEGKGSLFSITFYVVDESGEEVEIPVKVEASGPFEALAKAAGYAHKEYPAISGTIKSERFVDYAMAMIKRSHD